MTALLLTWLLAAAPTPIPNPAPGPVPPEWLLSTQDGSEDVLARRILGISEGFLGTAYLHSPLGEGSGIDPDPTIRFDAVDCLTFVEETLALSLARTPTDTEAYLARLRYAADRVAYEERNHLMEAQWLPNNVRKGLLRDITRELAGNAAVRTSKRLSDRSWAAESSKLLSIPADHQVKGEFGFDMVPLARALEVAKSAPPGTILVVIREEREAKVTRITHLGFVVHKKNRTWLRHAARSHYRAVVDEDLETFLSRNSKYAKWPVTGVAFYLAQLPSQGAPVQAAGTAP